MSNSQVFQLYFFFLYILSPKNLIKDVRTHYHHHVLRHLTEIPISNSRCSRLSDHLSNGDIICVHLHGLLHLLRDSTTAEERSWRPFILALRILRLDGRIDGDLNLNLSFPPLALISLTQTLFADSSSGFRDTSIHRNHLFLD